MCCLNIQGTGADLGHRAADPLAFHPPFCDDVDARSRLEVKSVPTSQAPTLEEVVAET
jgi:hypothetical protein